MLGTTFPVCWSTPTDDMSAATAGSRRVISATSCWCRTIPSKEMSWPASVNPTICPVSSVGRNPFGMRQKKTPVTTNVRASTAIVPLGWRKTHCRLRSYTSNMPVKTRSEAA